MPDATYKFCSSILTAERLKQAMEALPDFFKAMLGDCIVTAHYGLGSEIHADLQFVPMRVGTRWTDRFIADSISRGIVVPGRSDLLFTTPEERLEILFCHESDIHLGGKDDKLIQMLVTASEFSDVCFQPVLKSPNCGHVVPR